MADPWQYFTAERIAEVTECPVDAVRENHPRLVEQLEHCGITDRATQIAMAATVAIETASTYRPVVEAFYLGEPRASQHRATLEYAPFWGRGYIQLTHRSNYEKYGPKIAALWNTSPDQPDFDLVGDPERALDPDISAAVAALYFRDHGGDGQARIPQAARAGDWREVRRLVQGGTAGLDRLERIANALTADTPAPADPRYVFPVEGYPAGPIPLHWGISPNAADLFAPRGAPIRAMVDGTVDDASFNSLGGWSVYLIGDAATKSLHYYMAHMNEQPLVSAGQRVTAGQTIGYVGDTGNAAGTGTHLHIGIGKTIKNGSGAEGGAGTPWPGNNCNKYLQRVLDVFGSAPFAPTPDPPPLPPAPAVPTMAEVKAALVAMVEPSDEEIGARYFRKELAELIAKLP